MAFDWDGVDVNRLENIIAFSEDYHGEIITAVVARALLDLHERVKALEKRTPTKCAKVRDLRAEVVSVPCFDAPAEEDGDG